MEFTTVRSKEKDNDIYLKSENWFRASRTTKKMCPSYLEVGKTCSQLFRARQTLLQLFGDRKKRIPAIRRPKNVVQNCQEQGKRLSNLFKVKKTGSQPERARKNCVPAIWKWKKLVPSYFEPNKHCCSYLEIEKSGSLLLGDQKCS